ncbi:MAG: VCBS repeat-containing protein [Nitrospirae bacterium]|nr:VCBS repeat-containing protein [Nitrospirota bacterium]
MKIIYTAIFMVLLMYCTGLRAAEDVPSGETAETAVARTVEAVLSLFNPVSGKVSEVADGKVLVKFSEAATLRKGMRFSVFREGRPFHHPVTGALIGYAEDFAGRIEATGETVKEGLHTCLIISGGPKAGDTVRISSSKIRVAFFQERKSDWGLSETFYASLKKTGRFEIVEVYTPTYKPEDLSQLARDRNAEAVLLFSTPVRDEKRFVKTALYWSDDAKMLAETEETAGAGLTDMAPPEEKFISSSLTETVPWGNYRLEAGQLFATGDVDGNGPAELVVSDGNDLRIYSFREELQATWVIKGSTGEKHISVDVLDVNNNGRAEIFVTSLAGDTAMKTDDGRPGGKTVGISVRSFVVEFDPSGGYRRIRDDLPYFFRAEGRMLLMQKFDPARGYGGAVNEGEWKDGDYQAGRQLALPPDVNIYGFTFVDWQNKGTDHIITFDDDGYVILYDGEGHALWRSGRSYGKFVHSFQTERYSVANPSVKRFVRGRLIPVRTGRGAEVLAVRRISLVSQAPGLGTKGAEVYSLWWDGSGMDEKPVLTDIPGNVTDYRVEGEKLFLIAKGDLLSFVKNAVTGEMSKGSVLYYYNLVNK